MKPQQFRKLKEIKIQVLYLIVNVIHFQQGKDFLLSFFFFFPFFFLTSSLLHFSLSLTLSFVSLRYLLSLFLCFYLSVICCLYFSASICLFVSVSVSPSLCLPCMSISFSLEFYKEELSKSSIWVLLWQVGRDWLILFDLWPWEATCFHNNFLLVSALIQAVYPVSHSSLVIICCINLF